VWIDARGKRVGDYGSVEQHTNAIEIPPEAAASGSRSYRIGCKSSTPTLLGGITVMKRIVLTLLFAACLLAVASPSLAQLRGEMVAAGFLSPVAFVADPVVPGVFYVLRQRGLVLVIRDGIVLARPFLDFRSMAMADADAGVLGMAFSPDAASGRVFFNFTNAFGQTVVARFNRSKVDPLIADPASRFDLLWPTGERVIRKLFNTHNGGHLAFGPDGYLYVGVGDGGGTNDPQNDAQNLVSLRGKMLRLDVNVADDDPKGYRVPLDNPYVNNPHAFAEIWSTGLRNPTRYSFDDVGEGATGALIIADLGESTREEINYQPAGVGGRNYGWRVREGRLDTPGAPPTTPASLPLSDPIYDYPRSDGQSVTGGFVYRGTRLPAQYRGRYFFADFKASRVWSMGLKIDPVTREATVVDVLEHTAEFGGSAALRGVSAFGRDLQGELYFTTFGGRVMRITSSASVTPGPSVPVVPVVPTIGPPNVPRDYSVVVTGSSVVLSWNAPLGGPTPAGYQLEIGSLPGASDRGTFALSGAPTNLTVRGIPAGTYYTRLRSVNGAGASAPTTENVVVVGAGSCSSPPPVPYQLAASVSGQQVQFAWAVPDTDSGPTSLLVEAGSASGSANLGVIAIDGTLRSAVVIVPPGAYFVRLRAHNACGTSAPSNEILINVH
jgi:glucose/arabinose dehydrogenase